MIGASLWGGIGVFFNMLSDVGFTQMQVVAIRVAAAAIALTLYLLVTDRSKLRVKLRDCWCFVGTGIVSLVFFNWCYFTAIQMTSLAVAAVLLYTSPIFVMLFSAVLFHESLTPRKLVALAVTFVGCVFVAGVFGGENAYSPLGIFIGICSGVGYALYSIFGRFALEKGYSSVTISEYTFLFATISAVPLPHLGGRPPAGPGPDPHWGAGDRRTLLCLPLHPLHPGALRGGDRQGCHPGHHGTGGGRCTQLFALPRVPAEPERGGHPVDLCLGGHAQPARQTEGRLLRGARRKTAGRPQNIRFAASLFWIR